MVELLHDMPAVAHAKIELKPMPPRSLSNDVQDLTVEVKEMGKNVAVLIEQVRMLQQAHVNMAVDSRDKVTTTELKSVRDALELEIARSGKVYSDAIGGHDDMLDSHDARLRDIEQSNAQIKEILANLKTTVDRIDKLLSWVRDKIIYILGIGAAAMFGAEFLIHKIKG